MNERNLYNFVKSAQNAQENRDYAKAEKLWLNLLPHATKLLGEEHPDIASCYCGLANIYERIGYYVEAEKYCLSSLEIRKNAFGIEHPITAESLDSLGCIYDDTGRYDEAERYIKQALTIRKQALGIEHLDTAKSLNNLGLLYNKIGRYTDAYECFECSLTTREKQLGINHLDTAASQNNLAVLYKNLGCYAEAEQLYLLSVKTLKKVLGTAHLHTAACLANLGILCRLTGRYAEAEEHIENALAIRIKLFGSNHFEIADALNILATIYDVTGRHTEAEQYLLRSIEIAENVLGTDHPDVNVHQYNLATVYVSTGRFDEAEFLYKRSLIFAERKFDTNSPALATTLYAFSLLYAEMGRLQAAILLCKRSVNIWQSLRQDINKIDDTKLLYFDKSIESCYEFLASMLINSGRYAEATFVMGMLKEKGQFELLRRDRQIDLATRIIAYDDAEIPLISRFGELGLTLSSLGKQEEALKQIKDRTPEQIQELSVLKEQLKKVNREFYEFLDNLHDTLPPREVTQIDQDSYKLINIADADANTIAIFTVTAEDSFHTVTVTPHGRKAFSADHKATDIATKVLKFRELLKDPEDPSYLILSQELYDIIIRPMEDELLSGCYTTILWMLNGALRLIPLAALHDGKQFVLEKFRNVCITTCSVIGQQPRDQWNGLGMGVTREHAGHSPLPAVKEELEGVINHHNTTGIIPGDILLDEAFTRESMESHLEDGYKAVHFASHFELNPANETLSYLLLGDGSKIRMDELRSMPKLFKGVDLVAFSACSTGLGTVSTRGREVDGIGYLGEMQGAKTVMATLWPVEDKSTSILMREFYRLRESGMTKAEALQQAQLTLLKGSFSSDDGHNFMHPYFWAPFILIGNGG